MTGGATFTFGRGNLRKVAALPRYAVGDLRARRARRSPDAWVFGSAFGVRDGALALLREVQAEVPQARVTWVAADEAEERAARAAGARVVHKGTPEAAEATRHAGVVVLTHGFGDVDRYSCAGAVIVQLWHGSPLKRLHIDSPAALHVPVLGSLPGGSALTAAMYARGTSRIDVLPVSSERVAPDLASAFALPRERVPVLGEPRTDVLFRGEPDDRRRDARTALEGAIGPLQGRRVVLHAPTWRDGELDPTIPTPAQWLAIDDWCAAHDCVLVLRPHPLSVGEFAARGDRIRLLDPTAHPELIPLLPAVDVLVTDYSSTVVDHALTGNPAVFLAPDHAAYASSRGFYRPYAEITDGRIALSWPEALDELDAVLAEGPNRDRALAHARRLASDYHQHRDGGSARRVLTHVQGLVRDRFPSASTVAAPAPERGAGDLVLFESFYGRNASCNPLAIDRELARRRTDLDRVWAVVDDTVEVPEGARRVVIGSPSWRSAREVATLVVTNDWIRDDWRPRRGQFVLQTWHGTPLKRIALGRRGKSVREMAAVVKQSSRWSAMLAQNPWAARTLARSYAVARPMWTLGYPRNDVIVRGDSGPARTRLGIPETARVVLYAPTWRDGDLAMRDLLDTDALAAALGPAWTVLVRGHARTMDDRPAAEGAGVLDVTAYPDASDLLALADVLITDYSSVMFDFSASGRPMVFFVPDLQDYGDRVRGYSFDLAASAPGPLVATVEQVVEAVTSAPADAPRWAQRYAAWRARYNPLDDGRASERVVDRLERIGAI